MWLLVDYGNIQTIDKSRGLGYVVDMLVNRIGPTRLKENELVNIRLYDGWYQGNTLSKNAQTIATEIEAFSPSPILVRGAEKAFPVRANVELARSLLSNPSKDILHTYRIRGFPTGLKCEKPPFKDCANEAECPWRRLPEFLLNRCCPAEGCNIHPKKIISRAEQKVVDTMITTDLIDLCSSGEKVALASSDDDMWPGISLSISRGASLIHLQTKPGQLTHGYYTEDLSQRYDQIEAQ